MLYQGRKLSLEQSQTIATLCFDAADESVNKFDQATLEELDEAARILAATDGLTGLLVTSAKKTFCVGADITEFGGLFQLPDEQLSARLAQIHASFACIEDLPFPTVTAVNGTALGGGLEMALATDYRVMAETASIGFPETKLGIFPGFGGTVRTPRLIGADNAITWIADARNRGADEAMAEGMVDAVVADDAVAGAGQDLLTRAIDGEFDWQARRRAKTSPVGLGQTEASMVFETARATIVGKTGDHYPAPMEMLERMVGSLSLGRDEAMAQEREGFARIGKTPEAAALIQLFLNGQAIKKKTQQYGDKARQVDKMAVLGAGIMGGGIAYQAASKAIPALMKDVKESAIEQGLQEAARHFSKAVERGKLDTRAMAEGMARIRPALTYAEFGDVDVTVEAVTENPDIKKKVLAETEDSIPDEAILASNTSSISTDELASALKRPENFLGMHFFNPVHRMPLVEVIRGENSSEEAVATVVNLAGRMGKTPIVVNNCPGFLVNRVLFPYFYGFQMLVNDGVDFAAIDQVMEGFGWPMGPAYLSDVVGIDTSCHVEQVLAAGYPDRMKFDNRSSLHVMYDNGRLGQKSGSGYYRYDKDRKGRVQKTPDDRAYELIKDVQQAAGNVDNQAIVDRMMLPMIIECARALEEDIVASPAEVDMGLIMGLGFPAFRGGALKYADSLGLKSVCDKADQYAHLGQLYEPTERMRQMAADGQSYYPVS